MKLKEAIRQATMEAMASDPKVVLIGVGITDTSANVFGTLTGLYEQYGPQRVIEGPVSENALTGVSIGLALSGYRPILIHHRADFTLLSMDQLINHAAKWRAMFGDQLRVPLVVRAIVGRGWGNGAQHTQSLHSTFAHFPGLKVVVPATVRDAHGLLLTAIHGEDPVMFIEHRWLHEDEGEVHEGAEPFISTTMTSGKDVTVAAIGPMVPEAIRVANDFGTRLSVEVINVRCLAPLDSEPILASLARTGRLVVAEPDWGPCSVASEIVARAAEAGVLAVPPVRVCWPHYPVPSGQALERQFYPGAADIQAAIEKVCSAAITLRTENMVKEFNGPF